MIFHVFGSHTAHPYLPDIAGARSFHGFQLHSHDYREKSIFVNKNVLVIGFGPSGAEIAHEASSVARKVGLISAFFVRKINRKILIV